MQSLFDDELVESKEEGNNENVEDTKENVHR